MRTIILDIDNKKITTLDGVVRSLYLTSCKKYFRFKLNNKQTMLHRYIAKVYLDNPNNLPEVNHIDGDTFNNNPNNLEWCTKLHNLHHAMDNGLHNWGRTPIIGTHIKTGEELIFKSQQEAATEGFSQPNIHKCLKGTRKQHKNYTWRYLV